MLPLGTQFSFVAVSVFLAVRNHLFVNHCYKQSLFFLIYVVKHSFLT